MDTNMIAMNREITSLRKLVLDYYAQVAIGKQQEDPTYEEEQAYSKVMDMLQECTESLLRLHFEETFFPVRPTVVCLCGSTRFMKAFQEANLRETLAGRIVLSVGCDTKSDEMLHITAEQKTMLDELHKCKIDLADEILVLNVGGYVGASTASEIEYARLHNKHIRWLEGCHECGCVQDLVECVTCGDRCCPEHHFSTPPAAFGDLFKDAESNILECFECGCK
jgi:hypothetical protein